MFCSECGEKAAGKFCASCGHRLDGTAAIVPSIPLPVDWSGVTDYETLLRIPEVRMRIARCAAQSKRSMTGEALLDMYGNALGKLSGLPVSLPMASLAHFAQNTYAKLGIKTGKSRVQFLAKPPGTILVALLCSLAKSGRVLREAYQRSDGCILTAALPSDLFALEGDLIIGVTRNQGGTQVEARTDIPGQLFDWGKSTRCLDAIFNELSGTLAA